MTPSVTHSSPVAAAVHLRRSAGSSPPLLLCQRLLSLLLLLSVFSALPRAAALSAVEAVQQRSLWYAGFEVVAIAVNGSTGDVFAADPSRHSVDRYSAGGSFLTSYTLPPSYGAFDPAALALYNNVLYAGDQSAPRVVRFDVASGSVLPPIACPPSFAECGAMTISPSTGDLTVADQWSVLLARLPALTPSAPAWTLSSSSTPPLPVSSIDSLAVDPTGLVYLSDSMTNSIFRVSATGSAVTNLTSQFNETFLEPTAVAWRNNDLYVYDEVMLYGSQTVSYTRARRFDLTTFQAMQEWDGVQPAFNPEATLGMAVDTSGNVYLSDVGDPTTQGRVVRFDAAGNQVSYTAPVAGYYNGEPAGVVYDPITCTFFFTDIGNSGVLQVAPDGTILNHFNLTAIHNGQFSSLAIDNTTNTFVLLGIQSNPLWRLNVTAPFTYTNIDTTAAGISNAASPSNVAVDSAGNIFFINTPLGSHSAVVKLNAQGQRNAAWDTAFSASAAAVSSALAGLSIDPTSNQLYVGGAGVVYRLSPGAAVLASFTVTTSSTPPLSVLYDPIGRHLFVATLAAILQYDASSCSQTGGAGCTPLGWLEPTTPAAFQVLQMAMYGADLVISDWNGHRLVVFSNTVGQRLSLPSSTCSSTLYFSYATTASSSSPSVCTQGVLSCTQALPWSSNYSCNQLLSGSHSYLPSPSAALIVTPLSNQSLPFTCQGQSGDFALPISSQGFTLPLGVGCAHLRTSGSAGAVVASSDSVSGAVSFGYSSSASTLQITCAAPSTSPTPAVVVFSYTAPGVCGAGSLLCQAYAGASSNGFACSALASGAHFALNSNGGVVSSTPLTWEPACYGLFGDGYLPLSNEGIALGLGFASTGACLNLFSLIAGSSSGAQLNIAGTTTLSNFSYHTSPFALTPQCSSSFSSSAALSSSLPPSSSAVASSSALTSAPLPSSPSPTSSASPTAPSPTSPPLRFSSSLASSVTSIPSVTSAATSPLSTAPPPPPPSSALPPSSPVLLSSGLSSARFVSSSGPLSSSATPSPGLSSSPLLTSAVVPPVPLPSTAPSSAIGTPTSSPMASSSSELPSASSSSAPPAGASSGSSAPVGAIAGGVVGGLVGCCLLLFLLIVARRRKGKAGDDAREKGSDDSTTAPSTPRSDASSSLPLSRLSSQRSSATTAAEPASAGVSAASSSVSQPSSDRFGTAGSDKFGTATGADDFGTSSSSVAYDSPATPAPGHFSTARDASLASAEFPSERSDFPSSSALTLNLNVDTVRSIQAGQNPRTSNNTDHVVFIH